MVLPNSSEHYQPLEHYGVIGNLHTIALVGMNGSIDWCCLPHFDSPSVFGVLLDYKSGGFFKISPTGPTKNKQFYLDETNILITRFVSPGGVAEIVDFMPVEEQPTKDINQHHLYRVIRVVRGDVEFQLDCFPSFNYGRSSHKVYRHRQGALFESKTVHLALHSPIPLSVKNGGVVARFKLRAGKSMTFTLRHVEESSPQKALEMPMAGEQALEKTNAFWHQWVSKIQYQGRWREVVTRSALVLKMLTFAPTGAIVASPTTSLPEVIGGKRNWDYRSTWIRDASFTLYALLRLGFSGEAKEFMGWIESRLTELDPGGSLQVVYGLHGEHTLKERILPKWQGYRNSRPVRIGNAAYAQSQMDIYGELMDSVYLYNKYGSPISYDMWTNLRRMLGYVCRHWRDKDQGIWEVRGAPQHFTYSKVMCWVALDRGLRLAHKRSFPADWNLWAKNRDAIYQDVMARGWDAKQKTFIQHYGTHAVDASALVFPLVKFVSPTDPRMLSTIQNVKNTLVSDSLVRRYEIGRGLGDSLSGKEGTFSMCTFWYVEALARSGQLQEARWTFEKMLGYASPLGLFSEQISATGEQLGNFPQAFTHLALISAAYNLDKLLEKNAKSST